MAVNRTLKKGAELDPWFYRHEDVDGDDVDFSSGYTFTMKAAPLAGGATTFTKTTSITGLTTGIRVDWATTGELNSLTAGTTYLIELRARDSNTRDLDLEDVHLRVVATNQV